MYTYNSDSLSHASKIQAFDKDSFTMETAMLACVGHGLRHGLHHHCAYTPGYHLFVQRHTCKLESILVLLSCLK